MSAPPVVFIDIETTGLDVREHEVWEVALIAADGTEKVWRLKPHHLERASPDALRITRYYERTGRPSWLWGLESDTAHEVAVATAGVHLVGAVPSFDAIFLTELLRRWALVPAWHYHLVDVEALAAGRLGMAPPWDSDALAARLGIARNDPLFEKHAALGDARWAKAIYEAVLGPATGTVAGIAGGVGGTGL